MWKCTSRCNPFTTLFPRRYISHSVDLRQSVAKETVYRAEDQGYRLSFETAMAWDVMSTYTTSRCRLSRTGRSSSQLNMVYNVCWGQDRSVVTRKAPIIRFCAFTDNVSKLTAPCPSPCSRPITWCRRKAKARLSVFSGLSHQQSESPNCFRATDVRGCCLAPATDPAQRLCRGKQAGVAVDIALKENYSLKEHVYTYLDSFGTTM